MFGIYFRHGVFNRRLTKEGPTLALGRRKPHAIATRWFTDLGHKVNKDYERAIFFKNQLFKNQPKNFSSNSLLINRPVCLQSLKKWGWKHFEQKNSMTLCMNDSTLYFVKCVSGLIFAPNLKLSVSVKSYHRNMSNTHRTSIFWQTEKTYWKVWNGRLERENKLNPKTGLGVEASAGDFRLRRLLACGIFWEKKMPKAKRVDSKYSHAFSPKKSFHFQVSLGWHWGVLPPPPQLSTRRRERGEGKTAVGFAQKSIGKLWQGMIEIPNKRWDIESCDDASRSVSKTI